MHHPPCPDLCAGWPAFDEESASGRGQLDSLNVGLEWMYYADDDTGGFRNFPGNVEYRNFMGFYVDYEPRYPPPFRSHEAWWWSASDAWGCVSMGLGCDRGTHCRRPA